MILSRAMSCGNGCLAHPLITSMFIAPPPHPCFLTEQMTFMPETISPPDSEEGRILCAALDPTALKLLPPHTNSDFRGFHS